MLIYQRVTPCDPQPTTRSKRRPCRVWRAGATHGRCEDSAGASRTLMHVDPYGTYHEWLINLI
jgi:hypothetical protein